MDQDHDHGALRRIDRIRTDLVTPARVAARVPLDTLAWAAQGEPVPFADAVSADYTQLTPGTPWGPPWSTLWLRIEGRVPEDWPDDATVEVAVDLGFSRTAVGFQAEGLFRDADGAPLAGLEPRNRRVSLPEARAGDPVLVHVEAAANPDLADDWSFRPTALGERATAGTEPLYTFGGAALERADPEVVELDRDWELLRSLVDVLPVESARRARVVRALQTAADATASGAPATVVREHLAPVLREPAAQQVHEVSAIGHAHIDSAWLWPLRETIRKCARTFTNVLDLMDQDPTVVFAASSAQQYQWMRDHEPQVFERIRARVREGRWVAIGGMWVESDTNLPSGESLVRQFVLGDAFFRDELGAGLDVVWLPDSFGFTAAFPQIARAAGATAFVTQKLSWNDTDRMPHHTFAWEGIDGSRLLTHFPPVDSYNAELLPAELTRASDQHAEKGLSDRSIVPFGYGDGGGGPTADMVARGVRARDLDGLPRVRFEPPAAFFARVRDELPDPAVWSGELYLELHRGTYTSQARTKLGNRRNEALLHEAELWATTAAVRVGADYPAQALREAWEWVLLGQFHDILPGSSIAWVHREAEDRHARTSELLEGLVTEALTALGSAPSGDGRYRANASPVAAEGVEAFSAAPSTTRTSATVRRDDAGIVLESATLRVVLDAGGVVRSLVDRSAGREYVAPGDGANRLEPFHDVPAQWDAWDVDAAHRRTPVGAVEVVGVDIDGEGVTVRRRVGRSEVDQRLSISHDGGALDVATTVDWSERHVLLKLAFDLDVHAHESMSEIQFGYVRRPTHTNTSWDSARFEVPGHRWVRVEDATAGVTISNDRVHGRDVTRRTREDGGTTTTVRESLLRAPTFPDPDADQGRHVFRHRVRPGTLAEGVADGYRLRVPVRRVAGAVEPLVTVQGAGVVVETVKLAEDGSGDVVVRLYESLGGRAVATVVPDFEAVDCTRTDLHERPLPDAADVVDLDHLSLRAFELVTLRFATAAAHPVPPKEPTG